MGPPGAGKGTQAAKLCARSGMPKISTGDILRRRIAEGSPLSRRVKMLMDAGELVSDDIIMELVKERLGGADCASGYLLDGFPRTIAQAKMMRSAEIGLDVVVVMVVDDDDIISRMSGRRVHLPSGRTYHITFNPPTRAGFDDVTGEPLAQRSDDEEKTVRGRLDVFHSETRPLIEHYQSQLDNGMQGAPRLVVLDGTGGVDEVEQRVVRGIASVL